MENKNYTDIAEATLKNNLSTVKDLLQKTSQDEMNQFLKLAVIKDSNHMIELFLNNGAIVDFSSNYNCLVYLAKKNNIEGVKKIINGIDLYTYGDNALIIAAREGHVDMVRFLLENNANVHAKNDSAIKYAAENNHVEVLNVLIHFNADIDANKGRALILASLKGRYEAVACLLENGANAKGYMDCNKPIDLANFGQHSAVVSLLKEYGADLKQVKHEPINQGHLKELISILKDVKEIFPSNDEIQGKLTEKIMKNELILPLFPKEPRKPDRKFDKFLSNLIEPDKKQKKSPKFK